MTTPQAARRAGYRSPRGRFYTVPNEDGKPVDLPSVTTLLSMMAHPALDVWRLKTVVSVLAERPDLVALAGTDPYDAQRQALDYRREASNYGTAMHGYSEAADARVLDLALVPDSIRTQMLHYVELRQRLAWEVAESEATVYNHEVGYAGTFDRLLRFPSHPEWGAVVADIKTGKSVYEDVSIQMAMYANAEGIYTGFEFRPLPDDLNHELGIVIHLRPDGAKLHPVDLRPGWRAGKLLASLRRDWFDTPARIGPGITTDDELYLASNPGPQVVDMEPGMHGMDRIISIEPPKPKDNEAAAVAAVTTAFPDSQVIDLTPLTSEAIRVGLANRLRALDGDLLAEVASHVRANGAPKMSDPSFSPDHVREYEIALEIAEHAQHQRRIRNV